MISMEIVTDDDHLVRASPADDGDVISLVDFGHV